MYCEAEDHLVNLEHCGGREQRRAYLNILLAVTRVGYRAIARGQGILRELQIRDSGNRQPFALIVDKACLMFDVRQPALDLHPQLPVEANNLFGDAIVDAGSGSQLRIRISTADDADRVAEWLFGPSVPASGAALPEPPTRKADGPARVRWARDRTIGV